ncbi:MAG: Inorganic diphosphatase [Pedosphaera sp.]|nr:Inorganic diphosphatase [Pedosphaera sp.]
MNFLNLPIGPRAPDVVNAVIEVPLGQSNKYEYDKSLHVFRLDRPLYSSVYYPCEYGFIPGTLGEDGDALDILVLASHPSFSGCLVEVRPVGALNMVDQGVPDQKIFAVGAKNPEHKHIVTYSNIFPHLLREIENFFSIYKELEGKRTEVLGWLDVSHAKDLIMKCHQRFTKD